MIKSVGYPVMVDIGNNTLYSVYVDNKLMFAGRSVESSIDIAPLLRDYLNSERIIIDWPTGEGIKNATTQLNAGVARIYKKASDEETSIYVVLDGMNPGDITPLIHVANDYNEDCQTDFDGDPYITSVFVRNEVDRRQIVFLGANSDQDSLTLNINGEDVPAGPINAASIPIGFNMRGMTIRFLNQNLMPYEADYFAMMFNGGSAVLEQDNQYIQVGYGSSWVNIFNGTWHLSEYTFPNDKDYIVTSNNLPAGTPGIWGWDSAIVTGDPYPLTADKVPAGFNLRNKTIVFTNIDKPMTDGQMFTDEISLWCRYPTSTNTLLIMTSTFDGGAGGEWEIYISGYGLSGTFNPVFWNINTGWRQTSFTFPDDQDYIVYYNELRPAVGDSWGWNYAIIIDGSQSIASPSIIVRALLAGVDSLSFKVSDASGMRDSLDVKISPCVLYRYALYAVNRRGGITHIVCEGKPLESYQKSNWDIDTDYDRLSQVARGTRRMSVTSTRRWRLNTGYLTEAEAKHIDDIITSPRIVLHDLETGRLFAVNSTDGTIEQRTRVSNGTKPIEYTLTFEEARTEIRR